MVNTGSGYLANLDRAVEALGPLRAPESRCSVTPEMVKEGQQRAHLLRAKAVRLAVQSLRKAWGGVLNGHQGN